MTMFIAAMPSWAWYVLGGLGVLALFVCGMWYVIYKLLIEEDEDGEDWGMVDVEGKREQETPDAPRP